MDGLFSRNAGSDDAVGRRSLHSSPRDLVAPDKARLAVRGGHLMARLTYWLTSLLAAAFVVTLVLCTPPACAQTMGLHLVTAHFGSPPKQRLHSKTLGVYLRTDAGLTL